LLTEIADDPLDFLAAHTDRQQNQLNFRAHQTPAPVFIQGIAAAFPMSPQVCIKS
jgi:hypothetical protein